MSPYSVGDQRAKPSPATVLLPPYPLSSYTPVIDTLSDPLAGYDPLAEYDNLLRRHGGRHSGRPVGVLHSPGVIRYQDPYDVRGWLIYRGPRYVGRVIPLAIPFLWSASYQGSVRLALTCNHAIHRLLALDAVAASHSGPHP
ncbi:MAG: hypothetical protein OXM88_09240 [bacterium]|nr:hypothetical protein [bacterium]